MKESVKITVIAAGFREVAGRKTAQRPSYLPKTWAAKREQPDAPVAPQQTNVVQQVARNVARSGAGNARRTISTFRRSSAARRKRLSGVAGLFS